MAKRINEYKVDIKVTDGSCPKSCWNTKCSECGKFIGIKIDDDGKEYL